MALLVPVVSATVNGVEHLLYSLQPKQLEAYRQTPLMGATATHIGYGGAAGGAKSHTARAIAAAIALRWPGSTTIIFRRTRPEVWNNHWVRFRMEVPDFDGELYRANATAMELTWFNGSRTIFGYLERDEHVYRYIGNEYDCMIFEEATMQSWFQVNWLTSNRLRASVPGTVPFAMYLTNPGGPGHFWFKRLFIDRKFDPKKERPEKYVFVKATVYDNQVLLERDPDYLVKLEAQPEPYRSWYLLGDFHAGAGQALALDYGRHLVDPFEVPANWQIFRAFDWGFSHPFSFGWYAADEQRKVYKLQTITGRHLHDPEIVERIFHMEQSLDFLAEHRRAHKGQVRAAYTVAGHDCWSDIRSKVENLPITAETFANLKVPLQKASISRISGFRNFREYIHYRDTPPIIVPRFALFRTEENERCFEQLSTMVVDPDNREDVLKTDSDEYGEGGDDCYDETRYGLASRPLRPKAEPERDVADPSQYDKTFDRLTKELEKRRRAGGSGRAPIG